MDANWEGFKGPPGTGKIPYFDLGGGHMTVYIYVKFTRLYS